MTYFDSNIAPPLILGAAIFSIFYGIINAILIRNIDMTDASPIAGALVEFGIEEKDHIVPEN